MSVGAACWKPDRSQWRDDPGAAVGVDEDDATGRVKELVLVVVVPLDLLPPRQMAAGQSRWIMADYRHYLAGYY
jgi:hypothetical protein